MVLVGRRYPSRWYAFYLRKPIAWSHLGSYSGWNAHLSKDWRSWSLDSRWSFYWCTELVKLEILFLQKTSTMHSIYGWFNVRSFLMHTVGWCHCSARYGHGYKPELVYLSILSCFRATEFNGGAWVIYIFSYITFHLQMSGDNITSFNTTQHAL